MAYRGIGDFLTRVTLKAISKLDEADVTECMRIAENVNAWYSAGTINDDQLAQLLAALPVEVEPPAEETETSELAFDATEGE